VQQALAQGRLMVNPSAGILGVATGKSSDRPGEGAILIYVDESMAVSAPSTVDGVRTLVIPTTPGAVTLGSAPQNSFEANAAIPALSAPALNAAVVIKQQIAHNLMQQNPAFFAVGVGQSLDNPREAALVIYVDRKQIPAQLSATIEGIRVRYIVMDRMHVTRSYASSIQTRSRCMSRPAAGQTRASGLIRPLGLNIN
jgi:hypothetical protein